MGIYYVHFSRANINCIVLNFPRVVRHKPFGCFLLLVPFITPRNSLTIQSCLWFITPFLKRYLSLVNCFRPFHEVENGQINCTCVILVPHFVNTLPWENCTGTYIGCCSTACEGTGYNYMRAYSYWKRKSCCWPLSWMLSIHRSICVSLLFTK